MTEREIKAETTAMRRELMELKAKMVHMKDTYREIEMITQELRRHIA